jgi:hypothetical protein
LCDYNLIAAPEQQRLWRLIVLAAIFCCKNARPAGATIAGLQRGLEFLGRDVVYRAIHELEESGLVVRRTVRSGHPSGTMVSRFFPAPGVELNFNV